MSSTVRWSLLVAGEASLVLFLLTFGNTFTGSVPLHRTHLAILGVLGGIGWLAILTRPSRIPVVLVVAPLPLLAALAATSVWSPYPSLSWYATWQCAAYVGIAWLLSMQAGDVTGRRNLIAAMGIVATLVIAVYLVQVGLAWAEWLSFGFPVTSLPLRPLSGGGLVVIPTWVPDVIALCGPVVILSLWVASKRAAAIALGLTGFAAIFVSGTRSALLLVVVLVIFTAILVARDRGSRRVGGGAIFAAIGVVAVGLFVAVLPGRSFDAGRTSLWASAIDGFASSPIAGLGPGTYAVHRMDDSVDALSRLVHPDANNMILTVASDSGLIGLAAFGLAAAAYAVAVRRAWRADQSARPIIAASLLGLGIVAGHAMVDVTFALVGVLLLVLACVALASTRAMGATAMSGGRSRPLDAIMIAGLIVIISASIGVVRSEMTLSDVASADASLPGSPEAALAAARGATERSPDTVPGWWLRMVAADALGDVSDAIDSAGRIVQLEGFGQEWISLATLLSRSGDTVGALAALDRATAHPPIDPFVQLNAAIGYDALGAGNLAEEAIRRLYAVRPDIEPVLADGPASVAALVARVRSRAASELMGAGEQDSAILIALSGEDRDLATMLVGGVGLVEPVEAYWRAVVDAWFGDPAARATHDAAARADPTPASLEWSWRLAARACDEEATTQWERAIEIAAGRHPMAPTALGSAPQFRARLFPIRYPGVVWRMDHPQLAYPTGLWSYSLGRPACAGTAHG